MMAPDRDIRFIEAITDADGAHKAWELFSRTFGYEPSGVWAAPGRVNLIGEHTDYNALLLRWLPDGIRVCVQCLPSGRIL